MRDELSVVVGGVFGTAAFVTVFAIAEVLSAFTLRSFDRLAELAGTPGEPIVGFVLFVAVGVVAWPFAYLSLDAYLPGPSRVLRGVAFSLPLWVGYVVVFGTAARSLVGYAVVALVAHIVYGAAIGLAYDRLGDHSIGEY